MASGDARAQLQPSRSSRSAGTAATFVSACPAGRLDPPGLAPVPKVHVRPTSGKRHRKPSALDKHLRHVGLLQRFNRHKAKQVAGATQHKQARRQRFAEWGRQLRTAILRKERSPEQTSVSCDGNLLVPKHVTGPARPQLRAIACQDQADATTSADVVSLQQHHDVIQSWKPVAAAAQVKQLQETLAQQQQKLQHTLPRTLDPDSLRPDHLKQQQQRKERDTALHSSTCDAVHATQQRHSLTQGCKAPTGSVELDVDAFLDGLLHKAAQHTNIDSVPTAAAAAAASVACTNGGVQQETRTACPEPKSTTQKSSGSSSSKVRQPPAWALPEQHHAAVAAAAAEAEEESLLEFAEGLDWQDLLQDLDDQELSAAFKALEAAEAAAAGGELGADKQWQRCFVTALNAAAMASVVGSKGTKEEATQGAGRSHDDQHSATSSASTLRRAAAAAARRQHLINKLHCLTGGKAQQTSSAAGPGAASVCSSVNDNRLGPARAEGSLGPAGLSMTASGGGWDRSTVVSSNAADVGRLHTAIKQVEAEEVLIDNPDMKHVHSTASVRSLLSKLELAA